MPWKSMILLDVNVLIYAHRQDGLDHVKWLKPVLAGDVLQGYFEVISARHSASKPELGIVEFRAVLQNQQAIASIEIQGRFFANTGAA